MGHMSHMGLVKAFAETGGDWVIHLLVLASIVSLGVIIERVLVYRARRVVPGSAAERELSDAIARAVAAGDSPRDAVGAAVVLERRELERRLVLLNTLGNNAPFLGLLGTVLGVVRAFHDLAFASGAGPEAVMQGLSEALVATAIGILVALPCVIAYNLLSKTVEDRVADAEIAGRRLADALGRKR